MESLYLILGLGNPGAEYAGTRHNAGFIAVDRLGERWGARWKVESGFEARTARVEWSGCRVLLGQPLTYMNESGRAAAAMLRYYRIGIERVLVVLDDADLALGQIRLRPNGSSGGHHGLESVEKHLGSRAYARLRIGIGRRPGGRRDIAGYVLGRFGTDERPVLEQVMARVIGQIECWITQGVERAMNEFNGAVNAPESKDRQ